jgi:Zn finger protein HypA/HybF involved in hydrogenase expression
MPLVYTLNCSSCPNAWTSEDKSARCRNCGAENPKVVVGGCFGATPVPHRQYGG